MNDEIKLLCGQELISVSREEAKNILKQGPFGVFLEFMHPFTKSLVQKSFPFYYESVNTFNVNGKCFVSEYEGMRIYIPSDLDIYIKQQNKPKGYSFEFISSTGILTNGVFTTHNIIITVYAYFRIGCEFEECFAPYLTRSSHR